MLNMKTFTWTYFKRHKILSSKIDLFASILFHFLRSHSFNPEEHPNFPYEAFMQNYGYFYGVNPFMNPYMGMMGNNSYGYRGGNYNNQYYSNISTVKIFV